MPQSGEEFKYKALFPSAEGLLYKQENQVHFGCSSNTNDPASESGHLSFPSFLFPTIIHTMQILHTIELLKSH